MAALIARDRQPLPVIRTAAAPEVDTDEVALILAILDAALVAHAARKKLPSGCVIADCTLFATRLEHAEYALTLWASSKQLKVTPVVYDYGNTTMRVLRVHDGDPTLGVIATVQWPPEPKPALVLGALRGWRPTDHWTDDSTTSVDADGREVITKAVQP